MPSNKQKNVKRSVSRSDHMTTKTYLENQLVSQITTIYNVYKENDFKLFGLWVFNILGHNKKQFNVDISNIVKHPVHFTPLVLSWM